jgi:hypothetical protein
MVPAQRYRRTNGDEGDAGVTKILCAVFAAVSIGALCSRASSAHAETPPHTVQKVVDAFLQGRMAIKRGKLLLNCDVWNSSPESSQPAKSGSMIWFDGDKLRCDHQWAAMQWRDDEVPSATVTVACFNCLHTGELFSYTNAPAPDPTGRMAVTLLDASRQSHLMYPVPPPRWFGCFPIDSRNMVYWNARSLFNPTGAISNARITSEAVDGEPHIRFDWTDVSEGGQAVYRAWFVPGKQHALDRIEVTFKAGNVETTDSVLSQLQRHEASGLWFVSSWIYTRTKNGECTRKEKATVEIESLNEAIDPAVFSLKGVKFLKPGTPIAWHASSRPKGSNRFVWDGNEIVRANALPPERPCPLRGPQGRGR